MIGVRGQRFVAVNSTLREIIVHAYQLEPFQAIEGGPRWLEDRFDIAAVIPDSVSSVDAPRLMLRTLLGERFKLSVRWDKRDQSVYSLVVARSDGRLGPGLKRSTMDCEAWRAQRRQQLETLGDDPASAREFLESRRAATCDMVFEPFRVRIVAGSRTMADLARFLSRLQAVGAPVLDHTGLATAFDFQLVYAPRRADAAVESSARDSEAAPSLFAALEEQLGLRLQRTRGPVDVLVIERLEPLSKE